MTSPEQTLPQKLSAAGVATSDALISDCGIYRYMLTRKWEPSCYSLPIIMLNPSTADAREDDPTIRRCMSFARREGYGGIWVQNLFAYRATSPAAMKAATDPFGPRRSSCRQKAGARRWSASAQQRTGIRSTRSTYPAISRSWSSQHDRRLLQSREPRHVR
jgi:hypothetical protein